MKTTYLFPRQAKYLGALLAIPGFILGYLVVYQNYSISGFELQLRNKSTLFLPAVENFTNELALTLVIAGLLLIAFSRTKNEDELTAKIRLNSLYWAILVNYIAFTGFVIIAVMGYLTKSHLLNNIIEVITDNLQYLAFNFIVPLLIFTGRFYFLLYRNKNEFDVKPVHYLPHKPYRFVGKWTSVIIVLIAAATELFGWNESILDLLWLLPVSLLLCIYTSEKNEDEYINAIRLDAMQVAVYVNYAVLLLSNWFVYGPEFLIIQLINLVTIPLIFIAWFYYRVYQVSRQAEVKNI